MSPSLAALWVAFMHTFLHMTLCSVWIMQLLQQERTAQQKQKLTPGETASKRWRVKEDVMMKATPPVHFHLHMKTSTLAHTKIIQHKYHQIWWESILMKFKLSSLYSLNKYTCQHDSMHCHLELTCNMRCLWYGKVKVAHLKFHFLHSAAVM